MNFKTSIVVACTLALSGCFLELEVDGNGMASSALGAAVCDNTGGPSCTKEYLAESTETITAVPDPGWVFEAWELDPSSAPVCPISESPVCELHMPASVFTDPSHLTTTVKIKAVFSSEPGQDVATPILTQVSALFLAIFGQTPSTPTLHYWYGQIAIGEHTCFSLVDGLVGYWNYIVPGSPKLSSDYYSTCGETGSAGTPQDDLRVLPLIPSALRDVHLVEIPGANSATPDSDMRSSGNFTRPHIPPYRGTRDGRIAMQSRTRTTSDNASVFYFYLFEPKKIVDPFLQSSNGISIMSSTTPVSLKRTDFVGSNVPDRGTNATGETLHSAICDATHNNPQTCGQDGSKDCYTFTVITPYHNKGDPLNPNDDSIEIWGTEVTAEVTNPKTATAFFDTATTTPITTGAPQLGAIWENVDNGALLETMITEDGRLMVGRGSTLAISYDDGSGGTISGVYDAVYSAYGSEFEPCDPSRFKEKYPVAHMPYDPLIKQYWDVGDYPWRYPNGDLIPDGADLRGSYPWMDSKGKNIFLSTSHNNNTLFYLDNGVPKSHYAVRCVTDGACEGGPYPADITLIEQPDNTRSKTVIGLWTKGKAIVLDNMLNNIDWGLRMRPSFHREVKLFDDDDGWIRLGSGRDNRGDLSSVVIPGASGNINFLDSIESKFNHEPNLKPNVPRDVAWFMSNGTATDIVAFDDWINPHVLISSEMVQLKTSAQFVPDFSKIQNGASGIYETPSAGIVEGGGSAGAEHVALGGTRGKGFFARPSSGLRYDIPSQERDLSLDTWFIGVFVDPRVMNDTRYRRLLEFPDGSAIDLRGLNHLSFVTPGATRSNIRFNGDLPHGEYSHLAFRIHPNGDQVEIYRDGMLMANWENDTQESIFEMKPGALRLGRGVAVTPETGFHGWLDDFKVIGEAENMTSEEICNHALGSLVGLNSSSPPDLISEADIYPSIFYDSVVESGASGFSTYLCYDHNKNQDGWTDLNDLPSNVVSVRRQILFPEGPLVHGAPRPESAGNSFCLSCHAPDGFPGKPASLLVNALMLNSGLNLEDDTRRQPLQSPPYIFGNIPAMTWGAEPPSPIQDNTGRSIDAFISH